MAARPHASALTGGLGCAVTVLPPVEWGCDESDQDYCDDPEYAAVGADLGVAPRVDREVKHLRYEYGAQDDEPVFDHAWRLREKGRRLRRRFGSGGYEHGPNKR